MLKSCSQSHHPLKVMVPAEKSIARDGVTISESVSCPVDLEKITVVGEVKVRG